MTVDGNETRIRHGSRCVNVTRVLGVVPGFPPRGRDIEIEGLGYFLEDKTLELLSRRRSWQLRRGTPDPNGAHDSNERIEKGRVTTLAEQADHLPVMARQPCVERQRPLIEKSGTLSGREDLCDSIRDARSADQRSRCFARDVDGVGGSAKIGQPMHTDDQLRAARTSARRINQPCLERGPRAVTSEQVRGGGQRHRYAAGNFDGLPGSRRPNGRARPIDGAGRNAYCRIVRLRSGAAAVQCDGRQERDGFEGAAHILRLDSLTMEHARQCRTIGLVRHDREGISDRRHNSESRSA